jgi:hypothetical protein
MGLVVSFRSTFGRWLAVIVASSLAVAGLVVVASTVAAPRALADTAPAVAAGEPATVTADALPTMQINGIVWAQVVVGNTVYATGNFTKARPAGAAINTQDTAAGNIVAYAAGGAYINRMSDYCGGCRFNPRHRTGADACPFTTGYWAFLHRHRARFASNPRMAQAVRGLDRLTDLDALLEQHDQLGSQAP